MISKILKNVHFGPFSNLNTSFTSMDLYLYSPLHMSFFIYFTRPCKFEDVPHSSYRCLDPKLCRNKILKANFGPSLNLHTCSLGVDQISQCAEWRLWPMSF